MHRHHLVIVLALLGRLVSCSGDAKVLEDARSALLRGDHDRAATLVAGLTGEAADAVRGEVRTAREARSTARAALAALRARVPEAPEDEIYGELAALRKATSDPVLREEISVAKSRIYDAYAAAPRSRPREAGSTRPPPPPPPRESKPDPIPALADALAGLGEEVAARRAAEETSRPPVARPPAPPRATGEKGTARDQPAVAPPDDAPAEAAPASALDFENLARAHLANGLLPEAHDALLEAAARAELPEVRTALVEEARDVDDRRRLRRELVEACAADASAFLAQGIDAVDETGLRRAGRSRPWKDVGTSEWTILRRTTSLSARAVLGLVGEYLANRDEPRAWKELRALQHEERVAEAEVFGRVARHRGELVPDGGYVFDGDGWIAAGEAAERAQAQHANKLARAFAKAGAEERDALFEEFLAEGFETELRAALQARWNELAVRFAKNAGARRLRDLAARREELDRRRAAALALIFDEEEYFYPYNPPACPPERAKLYPAVQRRVDELVGAVREVWDDQGPVPLRGELADLVDEVHWLVRREDAWGKASILPDDLPYWLLGIDPDLEAVGLAEFAWDEDEREALARSRAVRRYNRANWQVSAVPENGRAPAKAELRQVEITNDYRLLLGRGALAWNPLVQAAAFDHSEYMANTGDFGHTEPDPERKGPGERMRRRGYDRGAGENCHAGGGDPMGAHVGWCHSSGHHRNLLAEGHREMASALVGSYWTQNFGSSETFLVELPGWSD